MSSASAKYSYGAVLTVSAGATGEYNLHTVTAAKKLTIKKLTVHFPSGVEYYLRIALLRGTMQRVPDDGYITGDNNTIQIECNVTYRSGEPIKIWYNNIDTANPHSCYILIEGEIE